MKAKDKFEDLTKEGCGRVVMHHFIENNSFLFGLMWHCICKCDKLGPGCPKFQFQ